MAIFAISDLHLALSVDKPMDIFGDRWAGYMDRIKAGWESTVGADDYVVIPGDVSWATYIDQAVLDFSFIESLPGRKIISKGNHDYWWTTKSKMQKFVENNGFFSISFMQNNSFDLGKAILCGTRGWKCPGDDDFSQEDRKIFNRELQRLELSLKSADEKGCSQILVALHYPPFNSNREPSELVALMKDYNVKLCVYGHLHGESFRNAVIGDFQGIEFRLVSADYLDFRPMVLVK